MNIKIASLLSCLSVLVAGIVSVAAELSNAVVESYQIQNQKFGDLLRPRDASSAEGAPIVLYSAQSWKCMTWKLHPAGEGSFQLQNHFTAKTFQVKAGDGGTKVVQVAFTKEAKERPAWKFTKLADGSYQIIGAKSGQALTAVQTDRGVGIVVAPWENKAEQKWQLQKIDPATLTM